MSRSKHYRPRTKRENAERVKAAAERLNGKPVDSLDEALDLFTRYLAVLYQEVSCPTCGEEEIDTTAPGRYECWRCRQEDRQRYFTVWDVLDSDDPDKATLPGTAENIQYRFECNHDTHDTGTKDAQSAQDTRIQQVDTNTSGGVPGEW